MTTCLRAFGLKCNAPLGCGQYLCPRCTRGTICSSGKAEDGMGRWAHE